MNHLPSSLFISWRKANKDFILYWVHETEKWPKNTWSVNVCAMLDVSVSWSVISAAESQNIILMIICSPGAFSCHQLNHQTASVKIWALTVETSLPPSLCLQLTHLQLCFWFSMRFGNVFMGFFHNSSRVKPQRCFTFNHLLLDQKVLQKALKCRNIKSHVCNQEAKSDSWKPSSHCACPSTKLSMRISDSAEPSCTTGSEEPLPEAGSDPVWRNIGVCSCWLCRAWRFVTSGWAAVLPNNFNNTAH